jgi:phenylalanyl-tRNA synthetase beta chain
LGVEIPAKDIARYLEGLEFKVEAEDVKRKTKTASLATRRSPLLRVTVPDHRLDVDGMDDLIEEIARMYGYENIPISRMNDELPPQRANGDLDQEEWVRDILIDAGLQEVITYVFTTSEREAMLTLPGSARPAILERPYVRLENPISADLTVLRQTLMHNMLRLVAANLRYRTRAAAFELGPVFYARRSDDVLLPRETAAELPEDKDLTLPLERRRLCIALTGPRQEVSWHAVGTTPMGFFDLKGVVESLLGGLHLGNAAFAPSDHPLYHPGRAAALKIDVQEVGVFGELHPLLREKFDLPAQPVLIGEFDFDALLARVRPSFGVTSPSRYPAVAQDLALVVDENIPADRVQALVVQTGGALLQRVVLFDVYHGDQIPRGKKSLAYSLTFQATDRTLSDADATKAREKISARLRRELGAQVRGA